MSHEPQRVHEVDWVLSTKKQSSYTTLVANVDLTQRIKMIGVDIADLSKQVLSDAARFGKGHEFPTTRRELTNDLRLARTMDLSSIMAAWAPAFGMGNVVNVQPNGAGNPTAWRHTIKFSTASTTRQPPVTTIYEELWAQTAVRRKLESLAVESFSISGRQREVAQLSMTLLGSGKTTQGAVTVPAVTTISLLDLGGAVFKFGTQGAPATLTDRLIDFSITVNQNLDADNGYAPGSGKFRSRVWFGTRRCSFSCSVWVDVATTDFHDAWLAETIRECSFKLVGDVIGPGPETHDIEILFPACRPTVQIAETDSKLVYRIAAGEDDVYKGAGGTPDEPIQIVVTNTTPAYLGV